MPRLVWWAFK
jgi:hypothetical protein